MITDMDLKTRILDLLRAYGEHGLTVEDARDITGRHHGHVSGALSLLHKDERIARLSAKRGGCKIYVHPDFVAGRATEKQGRR